jgi:predicted nucleic acid-binding protein
MTAPVFVDTNVFVYARDARTPLKQARAAEWLAFLWRERLGRTSTQVLSEYYVSVTQKLDPGLDPEDAWDDVTALFEWRPQPVDVAVVQRGREVQRRYRLSWWDGLVVAAAQLQEGATYGSVSVRSPFTLALGEEAAAYVAAPRATSPHPARGRPKRVR